MMILKRRNVEVEATERDEIEKLKAEGFSPFCVAPDEEERPDARPIAELTVKELRKAAEARGLNPSKALRAQELRDILEDTNDRSEENSTAGKTEKADRQNRRGRTSRTTA